MSDITEEILDLMFTSLLGTATPEQEERRVYLLETHPSLRSLHLDAVQLFTQLYRRIGASLFIKDDQEMTYTPELLEILLNEEQKAPAVERITPKPQIEKVPPKAKPKKTEIRVNKLWPLLALTSIAAMILIVVGAQIAAYYRPKPVATLHDSLDTQWLNNEWNQTPPRRLLTKSDPITLEKGLIELQFDNEAKLVLEGPSQFQIMNHDHLRLQYGQVYATIPKEAIGFKVSSTKTTIVDLGTEFGVHAVARGDTELHVTDGKTELFLGKPSTGNGLLVTEGIAKKVDTQSNTISDIALRAQGFVRDFNSITDHIW